MKMKYFRGKRSLLFLLFLNELSTAVANHSKFKTRQKSAFFTASAPSRTEFIDNFIGLADLPSKVHAKHKLEKRTSLYDGGVFVPHKSTTVVYKSRLVPVTYGFVIKKETLKENPALSKLGMKLMDKNPRADKDDLKPKSICAKGSKVLLKLLNSLSEDILKIKKKLLPEVERHESGHKGKMENTLNKKNKRNKNHFSKAWTRYLFCKTHKSKKCSLFLKRRRNNALARGIFSKRRNGIKGLRKRLRERKRLRKRLRERKRLRKRLRERKRLRKRIKLRKGTTHCRKCKVVKKNRHSRNRHYRRTKGLR